MDSVKQKIFMKKKWLLLFQHNISKVKTYFSNYTEFLSINTYEKYSILNSLDDSYKISNKFEFLLEYPDLGGFNIWTQTHNPLKSLPEESNGYSPILISYSLYGWRGLSISSSNNSTFLDGSPNEDGWYYSIGQKVTWVNQTIPGPYDVSKSPYVEEFDKYAVYIVKLWVKVSELFSCQCYSLSLKRGFSFVLLWLNS